MNVGQAARVPQQAARVTHASVADGLAARARAVGREPPVVVPLGRADVTGDADPFAALRPRATVHVASDAVLVGPAGGGSGAAACGRCLAIRWQRLRAIPERDALETGTGPVPVPVGAWPLPTAFVADATWALLRALAQGCAHPGTVHRLDLSTLAVDTVTLLPEPLCPAHPRASPLPDLALQARPKQDVGGTRLRRAADYALPVEALVNPVCGVLGPTTFSDLTAPTTAAVSGHFVERGLQGLGDIGWSGKAGSFAASRDLGLLEGLERYAGTRQRNGRSPVIASLDGLRERGVAALDPRQCGEYPDATYLHDPVLRRFSPSEEIEWVWGHSLRDNRPTLVPARSTYYGRRTPGDDFVFECSNGCATGSCLEEAVLHGLLELVERDAFLLGWYAGRSVTAIDPVSLPAPAAHALLDRAALYGYDVRLVDSRVDLSVPVVTALAVRHDRGPGTLSFAAGAALDPAAAAVAALAEALTYLPHLRGDAVARRAEIEAMAVDHDRVLTLRDHALLYAHPSCATHAERFLQPARTLSFAEAYSDPPATTDLREDLDRICGEIVVLGCDVIVVDQTTPEQARLGLATVRTIAPGLLPIDFGWGRQRALVMPRMRTAHRRAGLVTADLTEADLHRVPHPFC